MNLINTGAKCSLCNRSLTLWNVNTCTKCGKKMCSHHTHLIRNPHSFVLSSVCVGCSERPATLPHLEFSLQQAKHAVKR